MNKLPVRDQYGRYVSADNYTVYVPVICPTCNRVVDDKPATKREAPIPRCVKAVAPPVSQVGEKARAIAGLEVGDSVVFNDGKSVQNLRNIASRNHGKKFTIRNTDTGYRIWRTK